MNMKSLLRVKKIMAKKSFFFTGVLSLCVLGNAYGRNTEISIKNLISPHHPHYSKHGFRIVPDGISQCMIGIYSPYSHTAIYGEGYGTIGIHFKSSGWCQVWDSFQDFKVIDRDSGHVVGTFTWYKNTGADPRIDMIDNPGNFMVDVTHHKNDSSNKLNFRCGHHKGNTIE